MSYTCRVTIVNDGLSDAVIKIFPAEMEEAKVWLNRVKHKEWWEMVQQNMGRYAERGSRIEKPAPLHNDPKNLVIPTLKEEQIPLVRLDGWTLPPLPPEEKMPDWTNAQGSMLEVNKRIQDLEKTVTSLTNALSVAVNVAQKVESKPEPKPQQTKTESDPFECCGKKFKDQRGISAHKRHKHKE